MNEEVLFKQLIKKKKRFIIPVLVFFLLFYFFLPFAIWFFPNRLTLDRSFLMPWWWLYTFFLIFLTWFLSWMYWRKSLQFDELLVQMKKRD